jgi:pimeloyl-ACP methyl ester carboxylesterase
MSRTRNSGKKPLSSGKRIEILFYHMEQAPKKTYSFARTAKRLLLCAVGFYLLFFPNMGLGQRSFIYHPKVYSSADVDIMARAADLVRWTNTSGENIGFKRMSPRQPAQGNVMVMYGNGSTAVNSAHYAGDIQQVAALDVYILEYPGYEDRPGPPTQKRLFAAGAGALQMLPDHQPVYLVGESLGSGVASYLAGTYPDRIAGMILLSPFTSVVAVANYHFPILPWLLLTDRFPSQDYLKNYQGKVGITVDGRDTVVPEKFGLRLYHGYNGPKKLWQFPEGTHCQITEPITQFWQEAVAFWQSP